MTDNLHSFRFTGSKDSRNGYRYRVEMDGKELKGVTQFIVWANVDETAEVQLQFLTNDYEVDGAARLTIPVDGVPSMAKGECDFCAKGLSEIKAEVEPSTDGNMWSARICNRCLSRCCS